MHDALLDVAHRIEADTEFGAVSAQRLDLSARHRVGDRLVDVDGGHVVILGGQRQIGAPHRPAGQAEAVESLRAGDLVHQMQVDVNQVGCVIPTGDHNVVVPDLFGQGARLAGSHLEFASIRLVRGSPMDLGCDLSMRDANISL